MNPVSHGLVLVSAVCSPKLASQALNSVGNAVLLAIGQARRSHITDSVSLYFSTLIQGSKAMCTVGSTE